MKTILDRNSFGSARGLAGLNRAASLALLCFIALWPAPVRGLGVRIPNQDAEAIGRGNAFAATANNPSALYYNPAGITQLQGHNLQLGMLNYLGITSDYNSPSGVHAKTDYEIVPVPQLYYTYTPNNSQFSYGLGLYAPFGLGLQWPEHGPFRDLAIEGRLTYLTINPTIAWQVHRTLSIAIGPTINYSELKLRQGIGFVNPNDEFRFKGDDFDYGFHAGVLWQPHPQWSIGANYRSPTELNYEGHSELFPYQSPVSTSAKNSFPQIASGGISYRPTPNWNLEADVDWTDWNSVDTLTFKGAVNPFTGNTIALDLNWHSSWFYHFGVSRYFQRGYFLSLGYFYSENSTSEKFFTPYVPDTDLHVGSLGVGFKGPHWRWALAGQLITGPKRTVTGSQSPQPPSMSPPADGQYQFFVPAVTFSVGYHF